MTPAAREPAGEVWLRGTLAAREPTSDVVLR